MADVYGVNRTLKRTGTVNSIEPEEMGGVVKTLIDTYEASALAADSTIVLFGQDLPAEARIIDWVIDADANDIPGLSFGTSDSKAALMAAVDNTGADMFCMKINGVSATAGHEIVAGSGQTLVLHTTGATAGTGTIKVIVTYVTKG